MKNYHILILAALFTLGGCASFPRESGMESAASESRITLDFSTFTQGKGSFQLRSPDLPSAKILGEAVAGSGTIELTFQTLTYLGNWSEGWTEGTWPMTGKGTLIQDQDGWKFKVEGTPVIEEPTQGSIRLYGTYFNGEKALSLLSNRWDRIEAAVGFLQTKGLVKWDQGIVGKTFFPEIYGYDTLPSPGYETSYGESITWNKTYTAAQIPEQLQAVRNSGTLFRDFEEARALWQISFNWKEFWGHKSAAAVFQSMK